MPHKANAYHGRLTGLDLARGLAVIGMVLVNYVYVFSHDLVTRIELDPSALGEFPPLAQAIVGSVLVGLAGRAAAVFLVLFGMGMTLQRQRAGIQVLPGWARPQITRFLLLILGGFAFMPLWEADILHYIGLYGLLALPLLNLRTRWLLVVLAGLILGAEIWRWVFNYQNGWQIGAVGSHYQDMWSFTGQFRQLFFNGYHPVFPWLGFVVFGVFLGRLDLQNRGVIQRMLLAGVIVAATGFLAMFLGLPAGFFPADTLFIILGLANATWIIALCLLICLKVVQPHEGSLMNRMLRNMGRLALSHYPGHVWLGIIPVLVLRQERMDLSFEASFAAALIYLITTGIAGHLWLKNHRQGLLERLLRYLSSKAIPAGNVAPARTSETGKESSQRPS